ncbi:hypothetical protein [Aeromonas caviae]|uniref:hypothetical protein n=1 Tax=Aeromonas caviae TaxID=648 RepID=UPI0029DE72AF|nr:hypothetical protein [Aeromonas caviae]MDX7679097.1 hypothetical protein [Aeromonas caviae]
MDYVLNNFIPELAKIIAVVLSVAAGIPIWHKIQEFKTEQAKDLYEIYENIKKLSNESIEKNHAEILVVLSRLTTKKLTTDEIQWLIKEPGAFLNLKQYDSIGSRYIRIDLQDKKFRLTTRASTKRHRLIERAKIFFFVICYVAVMSILLFTTIAFTKNAIITIFIYFAIFFFISMSLWALFYLCGKIDKAVELDGKP